MASRSSRGAVTKTAIVLLAVPLLAQTPAPDSGTPQSPSQRVNERIQALQKESDALASHEQTLLVELRKLEIDRQIKVEQLAQIDRDLTETQRKLADASQRAEALRKSADEQRPDVEARLVQLYKLGRAGYWRLMLDVEDLRSVGRAYRTAAAMSQLDRDRIEQHQRTLAALDRERKALETRAKQIVALKDEAARARAAIDRTVAARSALVDSIDVRRDLNAQMTGELQAAQQRLQASVNQLDGTRSEAVTLPFRPFQGALPWPLRGTLTRGFGRESNTRFGTVLVRNGVELTTPENQIVHPIHEGTVAYADQFTGYGNLVIVDHGDRAYSLYGYLSSLSVTRGDRVDLSTELGLSGRNPSGTPALYFELRIDGKAVNPLQWLKR